MISFYNVFLFTSLFVTLACGLEKRQDLSGLPTCAQTCLVTALSTSSGGCSPTDFVCLCKSTAFEEGSAKCFISSCSDGDTVAAGNWALKTCAALGVALQIPGFSGSATSAANTSTSSSASTVPSTSATSVTNPSSTSTKSAAEAANSSGSTLSNPFVQFASFGLAVTFASRFV
ncbi:secreted protein [Melampsora americana]|nr:secreted protein [Melampsora americana]